MRYIKKSMLFVGTAFLAASLSAHAQAGKYDYKIVTLKDSKDNSEVLNSLESMDANGWEFMGSYAASFKAFKGEMGIAEKSDTWGKLIYRKLKTENYDNEY